MLSPVMSQSSPAATGGAGPNFEQRVGAFLLALLLTRSGPPFSPRAQIRRIRQQTEEMKWCTDDYFIEAQRPDGTLLRVLVQVKRAFALVANDPTCAEVFGDAWRDMPADNSTRRRTACCWSPAPASP